MSVKMIVRALEGPKVGYLLKNRWKIRFFHIILQNMVVTAWKLYIFIAVFPARSNGAIGFAVWADCRPIFITG